jgi:hypothetical protein
MQLPTTWQQYLDAMERDGTCGGIEELTAARAVFPDTTLELQLPDFTVTLHNAGYMGPRLLFESRTQHFNILERTPEAKAVHKAVVAAAVAKHH